MRSTGDTPPNDPPAVTGTGADIRADTSSDTDTGTGTDTAVGIVSYDGLAAARVGGAVEERDRVRTVVGTVPLNSDGDLDLAGAGERMRREEGWSRLIYVTDLPLTAEHRPVVRQARPDGSVAVVSLPALGVLGVSRRLRRQLAALHAFAEEAEDDSETTTDTGDDGEGSDDELAATHVLRGPLARLRLLAGMIRCNRPATLLRALTGCLAAVAATGGFGIFYGSIWQMAHSIPPWRLALTALVSVAVLCGWLVFHNGMWHRGGQVSPWRRRLDNLSTLGTVGLATCAIYLAAVAMMLFLAVVVVPPDYLAEQIAAPVGPTTYLAIAWFAACLGTMGGALGSNFDRDVTIRSATYSKREYARRVRSGYYDEDDGSQPARG